MNLTHKFSFVNYKIWDQQKKKIEMFSINHYNNLLATLDSDNQLSIFDLMTKKCPVQINLLSIDPKNEYPELKEFSINGLHFSKNSNFLALSFNEKPFVLLLNLSTANINSKPIFIAYRTAEYYRKVLLDPQNKYLFLECSNSNVYLKYFRDQEFNLKIYEFLVEEKAENSFQIEYITRFCGKKEKNVIILREKTLYIIKYSILKKKQQISEDTINLMMMFEMTYLNSNFVKMVFNQTFDKIIIMGNNKLEAGYYLKYDIEGDTVNSINFSHMKQIPEKKDNSDLMDAFFYKFHPKFNIYEEFLMTISTSNKQLLYKIVSINNISSIQFSSNPLDQKLVPYQIINIVCWDGSFLNFCQERDRISFGFIVSEIETPPTWANLGFKFKYIDSNIEYQENEDEFDKKKQEIKERDKKLNLGGDGYSRGFLSDFDVYKMIREGGKQKESNDILSKIMNRMNLN